MRAGNRADILGLGFPPFVFSFKNITLPDKSNKRNIFTFQWIAVVSENSVTFAVEKERKVYAKNHFRTFDAANDGIRADPRGVSAGSRTELPADTAVWVDRVGYGADGGEHPEGVATTGIGIGTGNIAE